MDLEKREKSEIVFDIEKAYDKIIRKKTFKQLENMEYKEECQNSLELISERWIKVRIGGSISQRKQTDLGIQQGWVLSVTIFLVAINGILGELENIATKKKQRVASKALQRVTIKLDA